MEKEMTNMEIFGLSKALNEAFNNEEKYLPAKLNYYITKNKNVLAQITEGIEEVRLNIIKQFGVLEEGKDYYSFSPENTKIANQELANLLNITQQVNILMVRLSDLEALEFTPKQMQALLFMIEED